MLVTYIISSLNARCYLSGTTCHTYPVLTCSAFLSGIKMFDLVHVQSALAQIPVEISCVVVDEMSDFESFA